MNNWVYSRNIWILVVFLVVAFFVVGVPYLLLRDVGSFFGSFFYWVLFTALVLSLCFWQLRFWEVG